jgi:hypothetical protein
MGNPDLWSGSYRNDVVFVQVLALKEKGHKDGEQAKTSTLNGH